MAKKLSKSKVYIGQGVAPGVAPGADVFDSISKVISVSGLDTTKDDIEHTDMESTAKEFFGDLANNGSLSFTCNRDFGDAGQLAARNGANEQVLRNIRIERLDSDLTVLETVDFTGEVMEWNEEAAQASPFTITGRIKASGVAVYS